MSLPLGGLDSHPRRPLLGGTGELGLRGYVFECVHRHVVWTCGTRSGPSVSKLDSEVVFSPTLSTIDQFT